MKQKIKSLESELKNLETTSQILEMTLNEEQKVKQDLISDVAALNRRLESQILKNEDLTECHLILQARLIASETNTNETHQKLDLENLKIQQLQSEVLELEEQIRTEVTKRLNLQKSLSTENLKVLDLQRQIFRLNEEFFAMTQNILIFESELDESIENSVLKTILKKTHIHAFELNEKIDGLTKVLRA
ncbi:hypothetical protein HK100_004244 [Physocladia obscura]|uniref:Uncharacterized protein n=1 Tax=Physocladia obscura TaxID=109957 RepID=A0AAD5ST74_9FUNG|nr:hypothetical protein HK100_004244 [Physocladia obscura]